VRGASVPFGFHKPVADPALPSDVQFFDPSECVVIGDEDQVQCQSLCADHHVEVAHRLSFAFQRDDVREQLLLKLTERALSSIYRWKVTPRTQRNELSPLAAFC
jgi:hypothetical protein